MNYTLNLPDDIIKILFLIQQALSSAINREAIPNFKRFFYWKYEIEYFHGIGESKRMKLKPVISILKIVFRDCV